MASPGQSLQRPRGNDDSDSEQPAPKRQARAPREKKPKLAPPLYKATVTSLAETQTSPQSQAAAAEVGEAMMLRIKKCLDRANHPNTPEAEASAALHVASRLMKQHNVSQAEVLAHMPPSEQKQYAGQSTVAITRLDGDRAKPVRQQSYLQTPVYVSRRHLLRHRRQHNLIAEWARPHKGVGGKNSYSHGICDQQYRDAKREKAAEENQAKKAEVEAIADKVKQEQLEAAAQLARLEQPPSASSDIPSSPGSDLESEGNGTGLTDNESDEDLGDLEDDVMHPTFEIKDEDEPLDPMGDIDLEIDNLVKTERKRSESPFTSVYDYPPDTKIKVGSDQSSENTGAAELSDSTALDTKWQSHTQLTVFRETSARIADEYIAEQGIEFVKTRKRRETTIHDHVAYQKGKEDSSKIDVRRKRLRSSDRSPEPAVRGSGTA